MTGPALFGHRSELLELAPLIRRAASLDPAGLARVRMAPHEVNALIRLPFGVLVGRRLAGEFGALSDATMAVGDLLGWLDGDPESPPLRDTEWRGATPPDRGWRRVETVPDDIVRGLVRAGALTLKQAAEREGVPGGQPRAEVTDSLLDSIVLTATDIGTRTVEVRLRPLSALVRMGFLARESHLGIDVAGRWIRLAASYGSAYIERADAGPGALGGLAVVSATRAAGAGVAHPHRGVGR